VNIGSILQWLAEHSLAVQAFAAMAGIVLTVALVVTTIIYARITGKILDESQKSRVAAEKQAVAAQKSVDLALQSLAEQRGLGPQIVKEAILDTKRLIKYWKVQAAHIEPPPHGNPDPSALVESPLVGAFDYARRVSDVCVRLLQEAHSNLRNAKSELEKAYITAKHQTPPANTGGAIGFLEQADKALDKALERVSKIPPQRDPEAG
jgi:hypothetical protein